MDAPSKVSTPPDGCLGPACGMNTVRVDNLGHKSLIVPCSIEQAIIAGGKSSEGNCVDLKQLSQCPLVLYLETQPRDAASVEIMTVFRACETADLVVRVL